jgi:N-acetylglucosaminyl-diphospho-decaprenol L-rhamnosyltransferase
MSTAPPLVRVVVVNFNGGPHLRRCIECLLRQTERRFESVIIDNGSTDASLDDLPSHPKLRVVRLGRNTGFARANNIGIDGCVAPLVALLNPDAFAEPGWLAALVRAAERWPAAVMFGSLQICADNPDLLDGAGDAYFCAGTFWRGGHAGARPPIAPSGEAFGPCAAAALYRTDWLRRVGGFDERFFCYAEDVDLAFRLRLAGGRCLQVPDAVVAHVGSATTGEASDFSVYHLARNQVWTFLKCMPWPLLALLLPAHIGLLGATLLRARKRGQAALVARALRDAVRVLPAIWLSRRAIQSQRRARVAQIAAALVWNPRALFQRAIVLKPFANGIAVTGKDSRPAASSPTSEMVPPVRTSLRGVAAKKV